MTTSVPNLTRSQILICMAATAVVLMAIAKAWIYFFDVTMVPMHWEPMNLAIGLGLGLLISLLSSIIHEIWGDYREAANTYLEMVLQPLEKIDLIWLGFLPGMSEELLFRGVALPALGMDNLALGISSLVFGLLHMASLKHWSYAMWAVVVGLSLGAVTIATNSLLPAVTAHVLTNSLSGLIWKLKHQEQPD
jgi:uncharacterized protein